MMNFGEAIEALKKGKRVARNGWNGKGMWVRLVNARNYTVDATRSGTHSLRPWLGMCTANKEFVPWVASQTDILAEDWVIVGRKN